MRSNQPPKEPLFDLLFETGFGIEALVLAGTALGFFALTRNPWLFLGVAVIAIVLALIVWHRFT
ncbi:MAG: hypothetical protein OER12_08640 [Acidimicrobiia bacterium]|nr:hypothetical protein [Acidimicrobiia bacterium]